MRKPLVVDAAQVTVANFEEIAEWCQGTIMNGDGIDPVVKGIDSIDPRNQYIRVRVTNPRSSRQTRAYVGDWILWSEQGYKIYNRKAFEASFMPKRDDASVV